MPAPSSDLLTATRTGTAQRHLFLYVNHPAGVIRAWDGIGNFTLSGQVYQGVGALGVISGISDSAEIQQHEVTCTLNSVAFSALRADDGDVRGVAATVVAALVTEGGSVLYSRTVFTGRGDFLKHRISGDMATLTLTLRGLLADWSAAPRAYWAPQDQQRLYAGDNGFNFIKGLQDAETSGWGLNPESSGSYIYTGYNGYIGTAAGGVSEAALAADGELRGIGSASSGIGIWRGSGGSNALHQGTVIYTDATTGIAPRYTLEGSRTYLTISGTKCYVDSSGDVRSPGGGLIYFSGSAANKLRLAAAITSVGASTGEQIGAYVVLNATGGLKFARRATGAALDISSTNWLGAIFDNENGAPMLKRASDNAAMTSAYYGGSELQYVYKDEISGTQAIFVADTLYVGGSVCTLGANGAVRAPSGGKVMRIAGTTNQFLRIWT